MHGPHALLAIDPPALHRGHAQVRGLDRRPAEVPADPSVQPQPVEAVRHAADPQVAGDAAEVPLGLDLAEAVARAQFHSRGRAKRVLARLPSKLNLCLPPFL